MNKKLLYYSAFKPKTMTVLKLHEGTTYPVLCTQSCPTFCDPTGCSPPGSSVYGTFQARILEWVAISFSRGSFWSRDHLLCHLLWQADSLPSAPPGKLVSFIDYSKDLNYIHHNKLWKIFKEMEVPDTLLVSW